MIKRLLILTVLSFTTISCVSSKLYKELEGKYTTLKNDYDSLNADSEAVLNDKNTLQNQFDQLQSDYDATLLERNQLQQDLTALQKKYDTLNDAYTALEQNSSIAIADNVQKNRELLAQLEAKELALEAENDRLLKLEADMQERSQRIAELEALIASKDQAMLYLLLLRAKDSPWNNAMEKYMCLWKINYCSSRAAGLLVQKVV
jgi:chemotaxis protein MotB